MQSRFEDSSGHVDWETLESRVGPHVLKAALVATFFDLKQRLNSKKYDTVLNTYTVLHTISLNATPETRELLADDVLEARFLAIQAGRSNTLAAALAQLLLDWSYMFGSEPLGVRYARVQQLLRPRAIPDIRPTAVAVAFERNAAAQQSEPNGQGFWRGFDFSQFLPRPTERPQKTGSSHVPDVNALPTPPPSALSRYSSNMEMNPSASPSFATPARPKVNQKSPQKGRISVESPMPGPAQRRGEPREERCDAALNGAAGFEQTAHGLTRVLQLNSAVLVRCLTELEQARAMNNARHVRSVLAKGSQAMDALERARARVHEIMVQPVPDAHLHALLEANDRCNQHVKRWKRFVIAQPVQPPSKDDIEEDELLKSLVDVRNAFSACRGAACQGQVRGPIAAVLARQPAFRLMDAVHLSKLADAAAQI